MTPIPGIVASQITGHLVTSSYESISTTTVGAGGQTSVTFSSIPSTYKHLQIRILGKTTRGTGNNGDYVKLNFNSDTAANYSWHNLAGDGATVTASAGASASYIEIQRFADSTTNVFGATVVDILEYANANIYKTVRSLGGVDLNGAGYIIMDSGNWRSTAAVSSITLVPNVGPNFAQYSSFALYGIK